MVNMNAVINDYKAKKIDLAEANKILEECGIQLEANGKVVCPDVNKINGIALLNSGTGSLDETIVKNGALVDDMGSMYVNVVIGNLIFEAESNKLVFLMKK